VRSAAIGAGAQRYASDQGFRASRLNARTQRFLGGQQNRQFFAGLDARNREFNVENARSNDFFSRDMDFRNAELAAGVSSSDRAIRADESSSNRRSNVAAAAALLAFF